MAHGGARPNAGRKPGAATKMNEAARKAATAVGISPLEYMLQVLRDEKRADEERMDAAKAAAPYIHARLSSVESKTEITHRNVVGLPTKAQSADEWESGISARH